MQTTRRLHQHSRPVRHLSRMEHPAVSLRIDALRRRDLLIGTGAAFGLGLAGCSNSSGESDPGDSATPTVIEHEFGSTTIPQQVERVVTIGYTDHDAVLALGVAPVGVNQWYQDMERGVGEWAEPLLGDTTPEFVSDSDQLSFERIAAMEPDVILGLYFEMDENDYGRLSEIAPTVVAPAGTAPYGIDWRTQTQLVGQSLNKAKEAQDLIDDLDDQVTATANDHPDFDGVTCNYVRLVPGGDYYAYTATDPRILLLSSLGLSLAPEIAAMDVDDFTVAVSPELIDTLECDVLLLTAEADEMLSTLSAVKRGSDIILEPVVEQAFSTCSVLSIPYVLDEVLSLLEDAVQKVDR